MFEHLRTPVLRLFRVPHDPEPPAGAPGSIRVFRAASNFYKLRLLAWAAGQLAALAGILFSLMLLEELQRAFEVRTEQSRPAASTDVSGPSSRPGGAESPSSVPSQSVNNTRGARSAGPADAIRRAAEDWPSWLFPLLTLVEWMGVGLYLLQIPFTYAIVRLEYEMRWYIVTDRSLRIRAGLASVLESTMSFANIQQVVVTQGPIQRLLNIADLRVQSAGGGGDHREAGRGESLHTGVFHGVENAPEIRDLILERLRAFREAGLGDPEDVNGGKTSAQGPTKTGGDVVTTAQDVLTEVRRLRQSLR